MAHKIPKIQYDNQSFVGDVSSGSAIITNIVSTENLSAGMKVSGTGIPLTALILSIDSPTQITLTINATATNLAVALVSYFEIVFEYPPVEIRGEKYDAKENISVSVSGIRQVSINYVEGTRALNFSFLTEALKVALETFYLEYAYLGQAFRYFDDQLSVSYIEYELNKLVFAPEKVAPKGVSAYVWNVGFEFRRAL